MKSRSKLAIVKALLFFWPLLSTLILVATNAIWRYLTLNAIYTNSFDTNALLSGALTILGHIIAFLTVPTVSFLLVRSAEAIDKLTIWFLACFSVITLLLQIFYRNTSVGFSHLDCYKQCVNTVLPYDLDAQVSIATVTCLIITFIINAVIAIKMYKKYSAKSL